MREWKWRGGRLVCGKVSLSIIDAWHMIPYDPEIAKACWRVLKPHHTDSQLRKNAKAYEKKALSEQGQEESGVPAESEV